MKPSLESLGESEGASAKAGSSKNSKRVNHIPQKGRQRLNKPKNSSTKPPQCELEFSQRVVSAIRSRRSPWRGKRIPKEHPDSLASLAKEFGLSIPTVSQIAAGKTWRFY